MKEKTIDKIIVIELKTMIVLIGMLIIASAILGIQHINNSRVNINNETFNSVDSVLVDTENEMNETVHSSSIRIHSKIKSMEGYVAYATEDHGAYAYGYGHRSSKLKAGDYCSRELAEELFYRDIETVEAEINKWIDARNIRLSQNEYDALVSFVFNLGIGNFKTYISERRDLIIYIENHDIQKLRAEWLEYCKAKVYDENGNLVVDDNGEPVKVVIKGLQNRREYEVRLFIDGIY